MKTALVMTTYLVPDERYKKTVKFLKHYKKLQPSWDIIVLDNHSPERDVADLNAEYLADKIISFPVHFDRPSLLDYKYLWRAVHYLQGFFEVPCGAVDPAKYAQHDYEPYEKIVYMDNDFFALSQDMFDYINGLESGWTTFWTPMFKFPETGCHVIVKGCEEFNAFVDCPQDEFIARHNGSIMEQVLPVTHVQMNLIGDRYGEYAPDSLFLPQWQGVDFWAQAKLEDTFE